MTQVTSINHLKELAYKENGDFVHFFILLAGGLTRSWKRISFRPNEKKQWLIITEIDESFQELIEVNLAKRTNIEDAIEKGAMFCSSL